MERATRNFGNPRRWIAVGAVLAALVAVVAAGFGIAGRRANAAANGAGGKDAEAAGSQSVSITTDFARSRKVERTVDVVGTFQGFEEVTVTPKVTGRVVRILHDVGDVVRTGDVLLEIDPTDYELAVEEALKAEQSELAKLGLEKLPEQDIDIAKLPSVIRAESMEKNALQRMRRAESLYRTKTMTQEEYDQVATDHRVAGATLQQIKMDARAILATARHKHAQWASAVQRLTDTQLEVPAPKIVAPGTGTNADYAVAERMVAEGEMVNAMAITANGSKGTFRLVMDRTLKLLAAVPERYVADVRKEQLVRVTTESYPGEVFHGTVSRLSPMVDRVSRTFQVEVLVPNESRLLRAGGFAKLAIVTKDNDQALTVPVSALSSFAGVNKVFVIRDGAAYPVTVAPGRSGHDWIEVAPQKAGALRPDDVVAISGHTLLVEGTPVEVRQTRTTNGK